MSIAHGYVNAKNAHNLQQLHADIVNFNKQLLNGIPTATDIGDSYTYSNGTIKCSSNDRSVLMNLYNWYAQRYKMLPDAEDFVNDDERLALKAYYAQKAPVMPLHIDCVDLTQCSCILRYKKMPFMQDSLFMHIDGKIHDFPSFKITRQQSMYKGTIFSADDIDAVKKTLSIFAQYTATMAKK